MSVDIQLPPTLVVDVSPRVSTVFAVAGKTGYVVLNVSDIQGLQTELDDIVLGEINLASPGNIGLITPGQASFTTLTAGNVGIGTTNPSELLTIEGTSSPSIKIRNNSTTGYAQILLGTDADQYAGQIFVNGTSQNNYGGSSSLNFLTNHAAPIAFTANSAGVPGLYISAANLVGVNTTTPATALDVNGVITARSSIIAGGNVGIGTTTPGSTLDIKSSGNTTATKSLNIVNSDGLSILSIDDGNNVNINSNNQATGGLNIYRAVGIENQNLTVGINGGVASFTARGGASANGWFSFRTYDGTTINTRMWIDATGNVGIGTTSPASALDVNGVTTLRSTIWLGSANQALIGVATSPDSLITGSIANDLCIRSQSFNTLFSNDSGNSFDLKLSGGNATFNGNISAADGTFTRIKIQTNTSDLQGVNQVLINPWPNSNYSSTANVVINSSANSSIPLVLRALELQTANLLQFEDWGNNHAFPFFDSTGILHTSTIKSLGGSLTFSEGSAGETFTIQYAQIILQTDNTNTSIFNGGTSLPTIIQGYNTSGSTYTNLQLQPNGGNVGIGTTTPASLVNAVSGVNDFRFSTGAGSVTPSIEVINTSGKAAALVAGTGGSAFTFDSSGFFCIQSDTHANFINNALGTGPILMMVLANGNVGIGTTTPATTLDVNGVTTLRGNVLFGPADNSHSMLKPDGAGVDIRLADDSGYANLAAAAGTFTTLAGDGGKVTILAGQYLDCPIGYYLADGVNGFFFSGGVHMQPAAVVGFAASNPNIGIINGISSGGAGTIYIGNGTAGDHSGTIQAAVATIDTLLSLTPGSAPGSPAEGMVYVNSTDHHTYEYNGTSWVSLDSPKVLTDAQNVVSTPTTTSLGYLGSPINSQSANYTTLITDSGKTVLHPASDNNARTFTIDSNANVQYPIGTIILFSNLANTVTISITDDTMYLLGSGSTGSRTLAAFGEAAAKKVGTTTWTIGGIGLT